MKSAYDMLYAHQEQMHNVRDIGVVEVKSKKKEEGKSESP
jgi:hypothetical protein